MRKPYDYVGAVYGGVQRDTRGDDLQQSVKRVLRRLVREAVDEVFDQANIDPEANDFHGGPMREFVARKLVP